jgi:uridine phosphorylase
MLRYKIFLITVFHYHLLLLITFGLVVAFAFFYIYKMKASELILNPDGSIYHLNLLPEDIAHDVIFVGDPDRVQQVSRHFDRIDFKKHKREFITHTGWFKGKRITVMSTGIGTDNVDIVINELDALVNIDFTTRAVKEKLTSLNIIRIGTSGSIHPEINCDEILVSALAIGTDNLGSYYPSKKADHPLLPGWSYLTKRYPFDLHNFPEAFKEGITLTCPGFYGPQGRVLRVNPVYTISIEDLHRETWKGYSFTNLEMETSALYLLAEALGHKAISINAILANRLSGKFSHHPAKTVDELIVHTLEWISTFSK